MCQLQSEEVRYIQLELQTKWDKCEKKWLGSFGMWYHWEVGSWCYERMWCLLLQGFCSPEKIDHSSWTAWPWTRKALLSFKASGTTHLMMQCTSQKIWILSSITGTTQNLTRERRFIAEVRVVSKLGVQKNLEFPDTVWTVLLKEDLWKV